MAEFVTVAKESDLSPGQSMCVIVKGRKVALFNVDGTVYAISDTCSHAEASLSEGELDGHVVTCPRHGARFDVRTGKALSLPAWAPVDTYEVKVENGEIKVAL
ncbi:MAG TPA: non-heme iron oxygenase ferredoxin subunit [Limnochordia bacterium]|nr:non-heme iron oxygenase ferredoxin subunit [Limnochordia bacterium]